MTPQQKILLTKFQTKQAKSIARTIDACREAAAMLPLTQGDFAVLCQHLNQARYIVTRRAR